MGTYRPGMVSPRIAGAYPTGTVGAAVCLVERISVMSEIILLVFGLTGLTLTIVRGAVFHSFRDWLLATRPNDVGYLFTCPQCMGFWVGLFGGSIYAELFFVPLYAGAVSLLAVLVDRWIARF